VRLPAGFDYAQADGRKKFLGEWATMGIAPLQGGGFSEAGAMLNAKLYLPAGAKGPALLTFKNFDVIKRYNKSNSYAMGITSLAQGFKGIRAISAPWPESDTPLSFSNKKRLQEALTAQGYDTHGIDGQIGPNSQKAIRAWQIANHVPADGYVEKQLYIKIVKAAGLTP
jgi:membrane-bound lytic murein transglycosylase B